MKPRSMVRKAPIAVIRPRMVVTFSIQRYTPVPPDRRVANDGTGMGRRSIAQNSLVKKWGIVFLW
jgi:hypothetical protein